MRHQLLSTATAALFVSGALGAQVPRGVSPQDAKLYTPSAKDTFTCLTNPTVAIPLSAVNDDYCDCPDGSDEPGTSACGHIEHGKRGIKGFWCGNKPGHIPAWLPLNRVNDGICDWEICCDGSDEWAQVGGVKCENRCKEIGEKVSKLLKEKRKIRREGGRKRKELIEKSKEIRKELEASSKKLEVEIEGLEKQVAALNEELKEVEARERAKAVKAGGSGAGKGVNAVKDAAQQRIEELRNWVEKLREEEKEVRDKLVEAEMMLKGLKDTYNPNFNDEGVKGTIRKWDDYVASGKNVGEGKRSDAEERDLEELVNGEGIDWDELIPEQEVSGGYNIGDYLPPIVRDWVRQCRADFRQLLVDNGLLQEYIPPITHESKAVIDAKAAVSAAEAVLASRKNTLTDNHSELRRDYGPSEVFRALKGVCIDRAIGEYKYEFCFFEKAYQRNIKDSGSSFLGDHKNIEIKPQTLSKRSEGVFPSDDAEEHHAERLSGVVLHYDGGHKCWNGPQRSARIELYCGVENEIRSVVEVEKCVYKFEVGTPVVCEGEEGVKVEDQVRDEL